ncbi:MAG: RagB/SusD family nutrient uptake outer membrane protein [Chitinophagaceae bacterium]|nr:RagB/SusD family nutrient uptake outer membrane protein [Chitinophagaceae bacterium]HQV59884.1 RagB/SusD family nutrient uptake outer membrane protein [Chitinophagaceae bacterium]HQV84322.1 RagB/SusD family nutrient uptake outer membrane protein [Chitinophagaceae bacterium]HQX71586.1 RagB/SusD family nutrient uptake outer membrane protein [Chitinophagaceae bacterium]HQZ74548.1 RagB/SusD family nutrient uptake outer membrane protein [Chitinophagaceae bacterium]
MKYIQIKSVFVTALFMLLFSTGCNKILDEQPRSIYEPGFFKTEKGVLGGITSQYAHLRFIFGQPYYYNTLETGTDEYTWAQSADQNFKDMDLSGVGNITAASSRSDALWGTAFSNINTASGIIENASAVGISAPLIAEARFFRAFDYFLLVQTFGGVPLDLGAGELKFNTTPSRTSVRNTVPEVYTKAIFPDLLTAINDLPATGRVTGGATKTLARLYLAKAYLTYAWWLQNPNNIPTYPLTTRTDPDGHDAAWYFQKAYDVSVEAIDNPGPFGLENTFYDVHVGGNDRNKEMLLYADHTQESEFYNGSPLTGFQSELGGGRNSAVWMVTWNYTVIRSAPNSNGTGSGVSSVQREAAQGLGRPYTRMAPPIGVFTNTFAEKTLDSRYDGTFNTVFRGNWPKGGTTNATLYNANDLPVAPGDPILSFLEYDSQAAGITYSTGANFPGKSYSNVGAGMLPGRADFVIAPSGISRIVFPNLWKMGVYRTGSVGLGEPNAPSTRPFKIAKFSELYFTAAEAAVKGATTVAGKSARDLINVIRARAGKWKFSNKDNAAYIADNSAAMIAATPATIDINYILAERSREFFGEGHRWFDLIRTQKWNELAGSYSICAPTYGAHTPQTFTRTIEPKHYIRPIPQAQLDGMEMTPEEKAAYQNPNYQ